MEFSGSVIKKLKIDDRFTMCNMAVEAGGKTGIIAPDEITFDYLKKVISSQLIATGKKINCKGSHMFDKFKSDQDAKYSQVVNIDVSTLKPQVACPHLPSNTKDVDKCRKIKIDQVVIGSCTNGRISDLKVAAEILKGKKIKKGLRVIIFPATHKIYAQAEQRKYLNIFLEAGCIISPATCGPCLGGHSGILDKGETALATTNRNFVGRMGDPGSFVYLSSPAVAAASSITGRITHPDEVVS